MSEQSQQCLDCCIPWLWKSIWNLYGPLVVVTEGEPMQYGHNKWCFHFPHTHGMIRSTGGFLNHIGIHQYIGIHSPIYFSPCESRYPLAISLPRAPVASHTMERLGPYSHVHLSSIVKKPARTRVQWEERSAGSKLILGAPYCTQQTAPYPLSIWEVYSSKPWNHQTFPVYTPDSQTGSW